MKYNIYEVMIMLAFVLICFDSVVFWIAGCLLLTIGGLHVIRHEEEYLERDNVEYHRTTHSDNVRKMSEHRNRRIKKHIA